MKQRQDTQLLKRNTSKINKIAQKWYNEHLKIKRPQERYDTPAASPSSLLKRSNEDG
jgi:hypothetical protein